jgi:hydroxymethylglutaryl-CoA reductase
MGHSSRIAGFHKLNLDERKEKLAELFGLDAGELDALCGRGNLPSELANLMIENAIGTFALPLGLGLNLNVNGRDYLVPMAIEEPSVVAAVSFACKLVREAGGFRASADEPVLTAQIQLTRYGSDPQATAAKILAAKEELLALANSFHPALVKRGGGAREVEVRVLPAPEGPAGEPLVIVHVHIDTQEAMGANLVNTSCCGSSRIWRIGGSRGRSAGCRSPRSRTGRGRATRWRRASCRRAASRRRTPTARRRTTRA